MIWLAMLCGSIIGWVVGRGTYEMPKEQRLRHTCPACGRDIVFRLKFYRKGEG